MGQMRQFQSTVFTFIVAQFVDLTVLSKYRSVLKKTIGLGNSKKKKKLTKSNEQSWFGLFEKGGIMMYHHVKYHVSSLFRQCCLCEISFCYEYGWKLDRSNLRRFLNSNLRLKLCMLMRQIFLHQIATMCVQIKSYPTTCGQWKLEVHSKIKCKIKIMDRITEKKDNLSSTCICRIKRENKKAIDCLKEN